MADHLTPADVAASRGVDVHIILAAIRAGELAAINWSRPGSRKPRWRISAQALADFERRRAASPPPPKQRRHRVKASEKVTQFV